MSAPKFTPGSWTAEDRGDRIAIHQPDNAPVWLGEVASVELSDLDDEQDGTARANASLIAAAPDHALLLAAFSKGAVRWEPFSLNTRFVKDTGKGELCVDGLRYVTALDAFGCPVLTDHLRAAVAKAVAT